MFKAPSTLLISAVTLAACIGGCNRSDTDNTTGMNRKRIDTPPPTSQAPAPRGRIDTAAPSTAAPSSAVPPPAPEPAPNPGATPAAPSGNPADPTGMPPGGERDAAITDQINQLIQGDTAITAEAKKVVTVRTVGGIVTLVGTVSAQTDKDIIEAKASRLPSVGRVDNKIVVSGTPKAP